MRKARPKKAAGGDRDGAARAAVTNTNTKTKKGKKGLTKMRSFARIKPMCADKEGGVDSSKMITGWKEDGEVEMNARTFTHFHGVVPPDATQEAVYRRICAPLVEKWLDGYDVDVLCYGQTGSGKTYTMFGPPRAMAEAASQLKSSGGGSSTISSKGVVKSDHGFILRACFAALEAVAGINGGERAGQEKAVLHGSMVEMSILSFTDQTVIDLLNKSKVCYVDKGHQLQGAKHVPLESAYDVVNMAAAVENRATRGTKMNDTSSRSHCATVLTLNVIDAERKLRRSTLKFFDLMGSERFKGANSAHDTSKSSKATMGGWEGIYANLSLSSLTDAVRTAAKARKSAGSKPFSAALDSVLNRLLGGSLHGSAITGMIICLSQAPRNGGETYLSLKYGEGMSRLLNAGKEQPRRDYAAALEKAKKAFDKASAIVSNGVQGKYQAIREAELEQAKTNLAILENLAGIGAKGGGGGGRGAAEV